MNTETNNKNQTEDATSGRSASACSINLTKAQREVVETLKKRAAILEHTHFSDRYKLSNVDGGFTPTSYPRTATINPMMKAKMFQVLHDQSTPEKTTYILSNEPVMPPDQNGGTPRNQNEIKP